MDFARDLLHKQGWKEGEGLGKNKNGITAPVQTRIKNNTAGLGFVQGKEYSDNWWDAAYKKAASNITIGETKGRKRKNEDKEAMDASQPVSDDELLRICGGRTGHKAARHGLDLSGKLARLKKQEIGTEKNKK